MARTYGLASDRVRAVEVVTGDGVLRRATPTEHPELFFALRGGKGALGVVTALEFDLVQQPTFYGGGLYFDGADAAAVLERWRTWSATLPEQATTSFAVLQLPPLPSVPPPLAGRLTLAVRFLWTGDAADGERLLGALRSAAPVLLDGVGVMPYAAIDAVHADPVDPMPVQERAALLDDLPAEAVQALLATAGPGSGSAQVIVEVRQLGGAVARPGRHESAVSHRSAAYSLLTIGVPGTPGLQESTAAVHEALAPWATGGLLPNFGAAADDVERRYDAPTLARLRAAVGAYDPSGVMAVGRAVTRG
jgi:hypothetical protein